MILDPVLTEPEVRRRRPVWMALSALFLDTELDAAELLHLAQLLRASGYTLPELEAMLTLEVAPAVGGNVLSVAGVWSGFDVEWLEARILGTRGRGRLLGKLPCLMVRADWARVKALYLAQQGPATDAAPE